MNNNRWLEATFFFSKDSLLFFPLLFHLNSFLFHYLKSERSFRTTISADLLKILWAQLVMWWVSQFLPSAADTVMWTEAWIVMLFVAASGGVVMSNWDCYFITAECNDNTYRRKKISQIRQCPVEVNYISTPCNVKRSHCKTVRRHCDYHLRRTCMKNLNVNRSRDPG